ncbi:MAG TPA: polymer-forming cytoskeletal protein [Polyangiaceae bacterium]|nr:polymer-forming cytoskeletal protein [Polyangiaceae bacterium]
MASTVIGPGITIEGEVIADDDVVVQGTIRGKLTSQDAVIIEAGATVEADVSAASVVVSGSVTGDVQAVDRVDLQSTGRLVGDVKAARLTIADGASFKGNVDMDV